MPCFWGAKATQLTIGYQYICINGHFPLARISVSLRHGLLKTPDMVRVESCSKSRPLLCALVTQYTFLLWPGASFYIIQRLTLSHKDSYTMYRYIIPKNDNKGIGGAIVGGAG